MRRRFVITISIRENGKGDTNTVVFDSIFVAFRSPCLDSGYHMRKAGSLSSLIVTNNNGWVNALEYSVFRIQTISWVLFVTMELRKRDTLYYDYMCFNNSAPKYYWINFWMHWFARVYHRSGYHSTNTA